MADTPTIMGYPQMNNSLAKLAKLTPYLDEVFKLATLTSLLDSDKSLMTAGANTNEIVVPSISMDGLAKYDRKKGYTAGDTNITHQTKTFDYERGRHFAIDAMDDEESFNIATSKLLSEFLRVKVAPELDAYRFSRYASLVPSDNKTSATLLDATNLMNAIKAALNTIDEKEATEDGRILFITPSLYSLIETMDTYKNKALLSRFSSIVRVPQSRFYTNIKLNDGTTSGETAGGFTKVTGLTGDDVGKNSKDINFMILEKAGIMQYVKHMVTNIFSPQQNQTADAWQLNFRIFGLNDAYDNKKDGFYLHTKA